jgi:hypothetical protein
VYTDIVTLFIIFHFSFFSMKMDKKTLTIVIAVGAIIIVGGLYYGYRRWQQQRLVAQVFSGLYGAGAGQLVNGKVTEQLAKEYAKQVVADEAKQKADDAREAAKTPEDKYNEIKETVTIGTVYPAANALIKPKIEKVFGKAKMTGYSSGYGGISGGFLAMYTVPRVVSSEDMNALSKAYADDGFTVVTETANSDGGSIALQKAGVASINLSFEGQSQEVSVMYIPQEPETPSAE